MESNSVSSPIIILKSDFDTFFFSICLKSEEEKMVESVESVEMFQIFKTKKTNRKLGSCS